MGARFWNDNATWNNGCRACDRAGFEHLHQPLERHIRMRRTPPDPSPAPAPAAPRTTRRRLDLRAQHQRVDEHADQIVERRLTATRDRRPDRDVRRSPTSRASSTANAACTTMNSVASCARANSTSARMQLRVDREPAPSRTAIRLPPPAAADRSADPAAPAHPPAPVASTPTCREISDSGSSSRPEHLPLPQRVIRVLHRQRRPPRRLTRAAAPHTPPSHPAPTAPSTNPSPAM